MGGVGYWDWEGTPSVPGIMSRSAFICLFVCVCVWLVYVVYEVAYFDMQSILIFISEGGSSNWGLCYHLIGYLVINIPN